VASGDFGSLGEPHVGPILVQADATFPTIKAADRAESVRGMPNQRSPLESQGAGATVGLAHPAFAGLQAMQLTPMQDGWHDVPQSGTRGLVRTTDGGC